jgi:hypothetical protein
MPASPIMSSSTWPTLGPTSAKVKRVLSPGGAYPSPSSRRPRSTGSTRSSPTGCGRGAEAHDPYRTFYALNTEAAFRVETLHLVEKEPS